MVFSFNTPTHAPTPTLSLNPLRLTTGWRRFKVAKEPLITLFFIFFKLDIFFEKKLFFQPLTLPAPPSSDLRSWKGWAGRTR